MPVAAPSTEQCRRRGTKQALNANVAGRPGSGRHSPSQNQQRLPLINVAGVLVPTMPLQRQEMITPWRFCVNSNLMATSALITAFVFDSNKPGFHDARLKLARGGDFGAYRLVIAMPLERLCATAALGFVLTLSPLAAAAQSTAPSAGVSDDVMPGTDGPIGDGSVADGAAAGRALHFVPIADACISAPNEADCGQVRALVTGCAADLDYALCEVLFEAPDQVFEDPQVLELARASLSEASERIAEMQFEEADGEIGEAVEATRAMSERTLLRGAENLNSHSGPPMTPAETVEP